jgi:hypothetical protein
LKRREQIFWLAVGGCFAIGVLSLVPGSHEICKEGGRGQPESCTPYQIIPFVGIKVAETLDKAGGIITAFATIAIAIFTLTLKRATDKLWAAGERQISAVEDANLISRESIVAARRAWLSVEDVKFIHPTRFTGEGFLLRVEATVKNLGQTPATSVRVDFESYYANENIENFPSANERVISRTRKSPRQLGTTIFPQDTLIQRLVWADDQNKIEKSITTRPNGERYGGLMVFVTVSYLIVGDEKRHVTHHTHGLLNIRIGTELAEGQHIDLPTEPFLAGAID